MRLRPTPEGAAPGLRGWLMPGRRQTPPAARLKTGPGRAITRGVSDKVFRFRLERVRWLRQ